VLASQEDVFKVATFAMIPAGVFPDPKTALGELILGLAIIKFHGSPRRDSRMMP
jgi:hypothetical protein